MRAPQTVTTAIRAAVLLGLAAVPANAQHPHGPPPGPPGLTKTHGGSSQSGGGTGSGGDVSGGTGGGATTRVRSLGVWLDDATIMDAAEAWLTVSVQRWAAPAGTGVDAPILDIAGGVGGQTQLFFSVPYSRVTYTGTPTAGETGTMYAGAKVALRTARSDSIGVSVTPTVEILSNSSIDGTGLSRVNLVLPASLEWRHSATRIYGSAGYFTRGSVFAGGAIEQTVAEHWALCGALTQAWATNGRSLSEQLGLSTTRTDLSGSVSWVSTHAMVFGSAARTISTLDPDATRYAFSVGVSLNLNRPVLRPPIVKP